MKKLRSLLLCFVLATCLASCGEGKFGGSGQEAEAVDGVMIVSSAKDFEELGVGIDVDTRFADNIVYSVVEEKIAQIEYDYQGSHYCLRGAANWEEETPLSGITGEMEEFELPEDEPLAQEIKVFVVKDAGRLATWEYEDKTYSLYTPDVPTKNEFINQATLGVGNSH